MLTHSQLYNFWLRSQGMWVSRLVTVSVNWLDNQELAAISQIHYLSATEFGVKMSWQYNKKSDSGNMCWCVDTDQPQLVFTNKSLTANSPPRIFDYRMLAENKLIITAGKYEEMFLLETDNHRLRELRIEGKLIRRLKEQKVTPETMQNLPIGLLKIAQPIIKMTS
jgi:hypothetical protein